jgi:hypothetical protein
VKRKDPLAERFHAVGKIPVLTPWIEAGGLSRPKANPSMQMALKAK